MVNNQPSGIRANRPANRRRPARALAVSALVPLALVVAGIVGLIGVMVGGALTRAGW